MKTGSTYVAFRNSDVEYDVEKLCHFIELPSSPSVFIVFGGPLAGSVAAVFRGTSSNRSYPEHQVNKHGSHPQDKGRRRCQLTILLFNWTCSRLVLEASAGVNFFLGKVEGSCSGQEQGSHTNGLHTPDYIELTQQE
jgi:hypothetical protein